MESIQKLIEQQRLFFIDDDGKKRLIKDYGMSIGDNGTNVHLHSDKEENKGNLYLNLADRMENVMRESLADRDSRRTLPHNWRDIQWDTSTFSKTRALIRHFAYHLALSIVKENKK